MLNIAIIGCGSYGTAHARALRALNEECDEVIGELRCAAFCDADPARAAALRTECGDADAYATTDAGRVFADASLDAVYIVTHHDSHADLAVRAAEAGLHLFIEKPLAISLPDCDRIIDAVARARVTAMTGFKFRFQPAVRTLRSLMPRPLITTAHALDDHWPDAFWANDPVRGGGNVVSEGVHILDLLAWLHDDEPSTLHAEGGNYGHPDLDILDNAVATIRFTRGGIATVAIGDSGRPPHISKFALTQTDGTRSAHLHARLTSLAISEGDRLRLQEDGEETGVTAGNRAFLRAIREGLPAPCTVLDGRRATAMALAIVASARSGRTIRFEQGTPLFTAAGMDAAGFSTGTRER